MLHTFNASYKKSTKLDLYVYKISFRFDISNFLQLVLGGWTFLSNSNVYVLSVNNSMCISQLCKVFLKFRTFQTYKLIKKAYRKGKTKLILQ